MPVEKVSVSMDSEVLAEARSQAGDRGLSAYISESVRVRLQRERLRKLITEWERKNGPIPPELIEEARQKWKRPPTPVKSRKTRTA